MVLADELLKQFRQIDTPTISNAIEGLKVRNPASGFCDRTARCLFPDLGVMCGYAVTAQVQTMSPEPGGIDKMFMELFRAVDASPRPSVVVFQEITGHTQFSAHCGEVLATVFKRTGAIGIVSDSAVRDLDEVRQLGMHYFAPGSVASHANFRIVRVQVPVTVCGLAVEPGDLLHGDTNGLLKIPTEGAEKLPELVRAVHSREGSLMEYIKSDEFNFDELEKMLLH